MEQAKDGTSPDYIPQREHYTKLVHDHFEAGELTWLDVLLEKVYLVASQTDKRGLHRAIYDLEDVLWDWHVAINRR